MAQLDCGNFKPTITLVYKICLPSHIDDILVKLSGSKSFNTLDVAAAYNQMEVDRSYMNSLNIATSKGLYRFKCSAFGIKTVPAIWQHAMEQVLSGLRGVDVYYDDTLATGISVKKCNGSLDAVMHRLKQFGLRLNKGKSKFMLYSCSICDILLMTSK